MKKTFITLITLCTASTAPLFGASTLISSFDFEGTNWWDDAQGAASFSGYQSAGVVLTEQTVIGDSAHYAQFNSNSATWGGSISGLNTSNFLVSFFMNASEIPVAGASDNPEWVFQTILGASAGEETAGTFKIGLGKDGCLKVGQAQVSATSVNNTTPLTLNTWHHVAVSFMDNADNPGTYSITAYVDGSVYGTGTSNTAAVWDSHVSLHEQNDNCTQRFRGGVDDLLFYNVDTNDDVLQLVSAQSARIPEPATATLSLVALGAMALRRRRTA